MRYRKLSNQDIRTIRQARANGVPALILCQRYRLHPSDIAYICHRRLNRSAGGPLTPAKNGGYSTAPKLSDAQVLQIRRMYQERNKHGRRLYTLRQLAQTFNVSTPLVTAIVNGKAYPWSGGPTRRPIQWSDRHCNRCYIQMPVGLKQPLCRHCVEHLQQNPEHILWKT